MSNFLFFFRAQSPFSNWYPSEFSEDGNTFMNNEQYMMYQKAMLFGDTAIADKILKNGNPKTVKSLGRKVRNFDQNEWDKHSMNIVTRGLVLKFGQDERLLKIMLGTGNKVFVEASPYDKIWGIGLDKTSAMKMSPKHWPGKNQLGTCLMEARELLFIENCRFSYDH